MKVILILADGMRPDALQQVQGTDRLCAVGASAMDALTVMPSVTLPCHISLFHSVDPERHGTITNVYAPQVRPVAGLFEVLHRAKKKNAMFYSWEELRDVSRPGSLNYAFFFSGAQNGYDQANSVLTQAAIDYIIRENPDFTFLYLGSPDAQGHKYGWMSSEYMDAVQDCVNQMHRVIEVVSQDYCVILTADHGGHDRSHGTDIAEDMTIPVIAIGKTIPPGSKLLQVSIRDIAPTVTQLLGVDADEAWEGKCFL